MYSVWWIVNDSDFLQDCGLKTRGWKETEASLINLVEAAKWARTSYA